MSASPTALSSPLSRRFLAVPAVRIPGRLAGIALLFLLIYGPTIYSEEQFLRSTFPAFESYSQNVPRLFPRFTPARIAGDGSFSGGLYRQHREYNSVLGACAVYAVLVAVLCLRH